MNDKIKKLRQLIAKITRIRYDSNKKITKRSLIVALYRVGCFHYPYAKDIAISRTDVDDESCYWAISKKDGREATDEDQSEETIDRLIDILGNRNDNPELLDSTQQ